MGCLVDNVASTPPPPVPPPFPPAPSIPNPSSSSLGTSTNFLLWQNNSLVSFLQLQGGTGAGQEEPDAKYGEEKRWREMRRRRKRADKEGEEERGEEGEEGDAYRSDSISLLFILLFFLR